MTIIRASTEDYDQIRERLADPTVIRYLADLPAVLKPFGAAVPSGVLFYDTLFKLARDLAKSDHRQGKRRRDALRSPDLRDAFIELRELLRLTAVAIVGGEWLSRPGDRETDEQDHGGEAQDQAGRASADGRHSVFECWERDGLSIESLILVDPAVTNEPPPARPSMTVEQVKTVILRVAQEQLRSEPLLDGGECPDEPPPVKLFEYFESPATGGSEAAGPTRRDAPIKALICDLASEGERSALIVGIFDPDLEEDNVGLARMYFRALLFVSTLLIRAERFRDHNDELAKALQELGSFRSGRPSTEDMTLAGYVVEPVRQFLKKACELGRRLFELADLRIYLPVDEDERVAQCAASSDESTRSHELREGTEGDHTDVASALMWYRANTKRSAPNTSQVKQWIFHHLELADYARLPQSTGARIYRLDAWAEHHLRPWRPGEAFYLEEAPAQDEAIRRGPTIVLCTPPPAAPAEPTTRPPLYATEGVFLMMFMGRSAGPEWVNVRGTSSVHASRVSRMEVFFNVVYHAFYSLLESRIREWCASVELRIRKIVDDIRDRADREEEEAAAEGEATDGEGESTEKLRAGKPREARPAKKKKPSKKEQLQSQQTRRDLYTPLARELQERLSLRAVTFYHPDATEEPNRFILRLLCQWPAQPDESLEFKFTAPISDASILTGYEASRRRPSPGTVFVPIKRRRRLVAVMRLDGVKPLFEIEGVGAPPVGVPTTLPGHFLEVITDVANPLGSILFEALTDRIARLRELYGDLGTRPEMRAAADQHLRGLFTVLDALSDRDSVPYTLIANRYDCSVTHVKNKLAELRELGFTLPIEVGG